MRYFISSLFFIASLISVFSFSKIKSSKIVNDNVATTNSVNDNEIIATNSINVKAAEDASAKSPATTEQASGFVDYARTLIGTPYLYGSVNPEKGLDCSGFVNCVSNHFGIKVPRSSVDFTDFGTTVETNDAKPGDLILFTGTDANKHIVGHIGIITDNHQGQVEFIHSSSGKANGVTVSELDGYYKTRFVKVIRIFPATNKIVA